MGRRRSKVAASLAALGMAVTMLAAVPAFAEDGAPFKRCEDLAGTDVAPDRIGLPTRGAVIRSATRTAAVPPPSDPKEDPDGELRRGLVPHCLVQGEISPVDDAAPPIRFAVNLPVTWNGKSLQSGGGGMGGVVITAPGEKGSGRIDPVPLDLPYPLERGYATYGSDGGHAAGDHKFLKSDEAFRNWAGDALKKTHDVAQIVIALAYGRDAERRYFTGESAGGREAVWLAQRYPGDYDGIIATSPVLSWTYIHLADNAIRTSLIQGWLDKDDIKLLADNTRAACDALDGLTDGVVARYMDCPNTAWQLRCPDGREAEGCLSDAQIRSVNTIRNPWSMPVTLAHGETRYAGFGVTGNEDGARYQYGFYTVGSERPSMPLEPGRGFERGRGAILNFSNLWVRHAIVQDETFEPYGFDPAPYRERIQYLSSLIDATDPDLDPFRTAGGKLIMYQPSADNALGTPMTAEYYRAVVEAIGQAGADEALRFYVGPGGGHNATGISQFDTLSLLESWVEKGQAPADQLAAVEIDPADMTRRREMPACRYPRFARYDGTGSPDSASSFTCTERADPLAYQPK